LADGHVLDPEVACRMNDSCQCHGPISLSRISETIAT